ncbi:MAG: transglutaminase family protein [Planctomycetota bacterium]
MSIFAPNLLRVLFCLTTVILGCTLSPASAQLTVKPKSKSSSKSRSPAEHPLESNHGIRFSEPIETEWEFGLTVNSTGNSGGILVTVPIPMNWPEQEVKLLKENRTANVSKYRTKNPTRETKQFSFSIHRMSGGVPESGSMVYQIRKKMIVRPKDTTLFQIPERPNSKVSSFLKPSPFIESKHKRIREIADDLNDKTLNGWDQAEANYRWVRKNVAYKFDRVIRSCLDALDQGQGDCEELSSLFIAICRAQGIPARAVWIPGHTYPEFYLEDEQGNGHWFPCQAAGTYEFGSMTETKPILQKGDRFKTRDANNRSTVVRYLQPTLICRMPDGQVTIDWIHRELKNESKIGGSAEKESGLK